MRTQRASNEARQLLFARMDGELRRKIGRKVGACACVGNRVKGRGRYIYIRYFVILTIHYFSAHTQHHTYTNTCLID